MKNKSALNWIFKNTKKYLPAVLLMTLFSALISVGYIVLAYISSFVLDIATGDKEGNIRFYIALLFLLILMQATLYVVISSLRVRVSGKTEMHLKSALLTAITTKEYAGVSRFHSGDVLNRFTGDVGVVVAAFVGIIPNAVSLIARLVAAFVVIAAFSPKLVLVVAILGVVVALAARVYSVFYKKIHKKYQQAEGETRSYMQECTENLVAIKAFGSKNSFAAKLKEYLLNTYRIMLRRNMIGNISSVAVYILFTGGYYAALSWGAFMVSSSGMTFGTLTALLAIVSQIRAPITGVSGLIPQYFSALASAERIMELEEIPNEPRPVKKEMVQFIYANAISLNLQDVTFSYDGVHKILQQTNMQVNKGDIVSLVGTSGEGKSTILRMLLGLYTPEKGYIYVTTDEGRHIIDSSLRGLFAYVPQGNMIFSGTIADNIRFCNEKATEEEIIAAAKCADLYDFIESLPEGLNTVLGERGTGLSEGQIQRIAIARAILSGAPILLLDECTSSLDEKTERNVLNNIKSMTDRTIIIISHRPAALALCDKVYEVQNGVCIRKD